MRTGDVIDREKCLGGRREAAGAMQQIGLVCRRRIEPEHLCALSHRHVTEGLGHERSADALDHKRYERFAMWGFDRDLQGDALFERFLDQIVRPGMTRADDERQMLQRLDAMANAAVQRHAGWHENDHFGFGQGDHGQVVGAATVDEREFRMAGRHGLASPVARGAGVHAHANSGMAGAKALDHPRKRAHTQGRRGGYIESPVAQSLYRSHRFLGVLQAQEHITRRGEQSPSAIRKHHAMAGSMEKRRAAFVFETTDCLRQRRLRDMARCRAAGKAPVIDYGKKMAEAPSIHNY